MTKLSAIKHAFQQILDVLYPPKCVSCGFAGSHFCADCRANLVHIRSPVCQKCGYPLSSVANTCQECQIHSFSNLNSVRSVAFFDSTFLRPAIHKFKYQNRRILSADFAHLLKDCYAANQLVTDIIVPVPLHKSRQKERGYNQSEVLAKSLAPLISQPIDQTSLIRWRATKAQMSLDAIQRQGNVADAFKCLSDELSNKTVLLIDDVFTTGATLNACARVLRQAGAKSIHGLTLARAA